MMKLITSFLRVAPAVLLVGFASTVSAESVDELITRLEKQEASLKTWELNGTTTMKGSFMSMDSTMKQVASRTADGAVKMRMEVKGKSTIMGASEPQEMAQTMVSDGKIMWSEQKAMGQTQVAKMAADPKMASQFGQFREMIKEEGVTATVKGTEEVNGEPCTVLEIARKDGDQTTTVTNWISDKSGLMLKMTMTSPMMGEVVTTITSYKINESVDESLFSYTPPAGVQVNDLTAMAEQAEAATKAAEAAAKGAEGAAAEPVSVGGN